MNKKQQGDVGVAAAVFYYSRLGYVVSVPLTDAARYDLVVELPDKGLQRIQCKTTGHKPAGGTVYEVGLRTTGGNQSWNHESKYINEEECDFVFAHCMNGDSYLFPSAYVQNKASIRLGKKQVQYKIT